jgi:hydroxymethylpyrimidine pyrophosphatase-like HAD family hydrolase
MGNAADIVKEAADRVTSSVDEEGIWNGLKELQLI